MRWEYIEKPERIRKLEWKEANLQDYEEACNTFSWETAKKKEITYFTDGTMNVSYNAIDRHADSPLRKNKVAFYWVSSDFKVEKYTYYELKRLTNRFANVLRELGFKKGDRLAIYLPRIPELLVAFLGTPKIGAILTLFFSGFGPEAIKTRMLDAEVKGIIVDHETKPELDKIREYIPSLEHVILVSRRAPLELGLGEVVYFPMRPGEVNYQEKMMRASEELEVEHMSPEDIFYVLYTSGTTGKPKGTIHVHESIIGPVVTTRWIHDLREDDIFWCTSDPGWVTGHSYTILGPLLLGGTALFFEGRFSAENWYKVIQMMRPTVWYTTPTALRMLMAAGKDVAKRYDLSSLRLIGSVGEPLNPEVIRWALDVYPAPIHDTWWMTETGCEMISNYPCMDIKPGSMGKPFPGIKASVVNEKGELQPPGETGYLVLKPGWPSMLRGLWRDPERYKRTYYWISPDWFVTGDMAFIDEEGYFWYQGRADDVIKTSGYRVGPFDVESVLVEHPAVAEAAAIGKPDPEEIRGEIIKVFVVLRPTHTPSEELKEEIRNWCKERLARYAYPREIEFRDALPKTRSGKIMRRVLKAMELGLPVGDLSTLAGLGEV